MGDGILLGDTKVMSARYDLAVFDDDGSYRTFFDIVRLVGFLYGLQHKALVIVCGFCLKYLFSGLHVHIIY